MLKKSMLLVPIWGTGLLAALLFAIGPAHAEATLHVYEMECIDSRIEHGTCIPKNCNSWCDGKGPSFQCELGVFKGRNWSNEDPQVTGSPELKVELACCDCSPAPANPSTDSAKSCWSDADCDNGNKCDRRETEAATSSGFFSKLTNWFRRKPDNNVEAGVCISSQVIDAMAACSTTTDCGDSELCLNGRCLAY